MKCIDHPEKTSRPNYLTFLSSLLLIFLFPPALADAYSGGSGTPEDPYQIATAQDLIDLGQTPDDYDKSFVLTADIELMDRVFDRAIIAPDIARDIDGPSFNGKGFLGRFDGRGHVIHNLCIDDRRGNYQGLFGRLGAGAEIANLGLDAVQVSGHTYVGGLVGENDYGTISSCHSTGTVRGEEEVGGLVGSNSGFPNAGPISSSYSTGTVSGEEEVGGLVGMNYGPISSSYSSGTVSGEDCVGGLVGYNNVFSTISSSYSTGTFSGGSCVGGLGGQNDRGTISSSHNTGTVSGARQIGGLVGGYLGGTISWSHSTGRVYGNYHVGGLVGLITKSGTISSSYSTGRVYGTYSVGGLLGTRSRSWSGTISSSYSTGRVFGTQDLGGLIGYMSESGTISSSFWDIESSEQTRSKGGTGLTTEQMQDSSVYLQADWDFMDENTNGIEDVWWMPASGTPRLWWQYGCAYSPRPIDNASTGQRDLTLQWNPGGPGIQHDVYFGDDEATVADANTASQDVFLGRQSAETLSYDLRNLEPGKTYYWRIDGVNDVDPTKVWKGSIWSFTITDFVMVNVLDDFESYDDHCNRIFFAWQDGGGHSGGEGVEAFAPNMEECDVIPYAGNETGAIVGNAEPPYASHVMVRDASQSMPIYYDNSTWPWFSEVEHTWPVAQDWTIHDADALTLYFKGEAENGEEPPYIAVEDSHGGVAVMYHSSVSAALSTEGQVWHISLADLDTLGVDISAITKLVIGVGNRANPQFSVATGKIYIDDIQLTKYMADHDDSEL